jgi:hypothetical protein
MRFGRHTYKIYLHNKISDSNSAWKIFTFHCKQQGSIEAENSAIELFKKDYLKAQMKHIYPPARFAVKNLRVHKRLKISRGKSRRQNGCLFGWISSKIFPTLRKQIAFPSKIATAILFLRE